MWSLRYFLLVMHARIIAFTQPASRSNSRTVPVLWQQRRRLVNIENHEVDGDTPGPCARTASALALIQLVEDLCENTTKECDLPQDIPLWDVSL